MEAAADTGRATYAEVRRWAVWLECFTARDLANAMGVNLEVGRRGVKALLWHGICEDTGDAVSGPEGPEAIISYVPLPPGPREHVTEVPPERIVGYTEILSRRGVGPVSRSNGRMRVSTPGLWRPGRSGPMPQKKKEAAEAEKRQK